MRSLFFNDAESEKPKSNEPNVTSFPKTETSFPKPETSFPKTETFQPTELSINPLYTEQLNKIIDMYEKGFNELNQPGYDFFEYYQAVVQAGADNPQIYQMALTMAKAMDNNVSKQSLLTQSDYYINEINKVYNGYVSSGNTKKQDLITQKDNENKALTSELKSLQDQLNNINLQIQNKQSQLSEINNKYQPLLDNINFKLQANDVAKDKILTSLNKVKTGINNNLN
jgi:ribonuclease HI